MKSPPQWFGSVCLLLLACTTPAMAWDVAVYDEFVRPAPTGGTVAADSPEGQTPQPLQPAEDGTIHVHAVRNSYVSLQLAVTDTDGGKFSIEADCDAEGIEIDLFQEWFHKNLKDGLYYADALIPLSGESTLELPDPHMAIEGQTTAGIWVDIYVPKDAKPGLSRCELTVSAGDEEIDIPMLLHVSETIVPDEDTITADHNSYGIGWIHRMYPDRVKRVTEGGGNFNGSDLFFQAIHDAYRLHYEHHGTLHMLGYGHSGRVTEYFAPKVEGRGHDIRVTSWDYFDRHFGPLMDGSAFADTRRGARPVPRVYTTINPSWPAAYLGWGTEAYEVEFVAIISEMVRHLEEKGWTDTQMEMFFNHKKRYKGFSWDGDETRFPKDNVFFKEYGRLLHKAAPKDGKVQFVFRHDASWLMRNQMTELKGVVDFWVCGGGILAFYPEAPKMVRDRGDMIWIYGGTSSAFGPTAGIITMPYRAWSMGTQGYCRWLTTNPGNDPWQNFTGGSTGMIFPGEKFGIDGPIPSIRLKIERNAIRDITRLDAIAADRGTETVRQEVAALADLKPADFWRPDAPILKLEPWQWSNATLGDDPTRFRQISPTLTGAWWQKVRSYIRSQEGQNQ